MDRISPGTFLRDQLVWLRRRSSPEERVQINWWIARIELLEPQAPRGEPLPPVSESEEATKAAAA